MNNGVHVLKRKDFQMKISLSIEEVCSMTGLGRTKIYEAIGNGDLHAKKWGKRTLILKADLDIFLAALNPYSTQKGA